MKNGKCSRIIPRRPSFALWTDVCGFDWRFWLAVENNRTPILIGRSKKYNCVFSQSTHSSKRLRHYLLIALHTRKERLVTKLVKFNNIGRFNTLGTSVHEEPWSKNKERGHLSILYHSQLPAASALYSRYVFKTDVETLNYLQHHWELLYSCTWQSCCKSSPWQHHHFWAVLAHKKT